MRYPVTFHDNIININMLRGNGGVTGGVTRPACPVTPDGREPRDVELLLRWAYQVEAAHTCEGAGLGAERRRLGCRAADWTRPIVDGGGPKVAVIHEDAERVHETVRALGLGRVVIAHAMAGTRPDWGEAGPLRVRPVYEFDRRGRRYVGMLFDSVGRPIACRVGYEGHGEPEIEAARHQWLDWWEALQSIRDALEPRLVRYRPTGPEAPLQPWRAASGEETKKSIDLALPY